MNYFEVRNSYNLYNSKITPIFFTPFVNVFILYKLDRATETLVSDT